MGVISPKRIRYALESQTIVQRLHSIKKLLLKTNFVNRDSNKRIFQEKSTHFPEEPLIITSTFIIQHSKFDILNWRGPVWLRLME